MSRGDAGVIIDSRHKPLALPSRSRFVLNTSGWIHPCSTLVSSLRIGYSKEAWNEEEAEVQSIQPRTRGEAIAYPLPVHPLAFCPTLYASVCSSTFLSDSRISLVAHDCRVARSLPLPSPYKEHEKVRLRWPHNFSLSATIKSQWNHKATFKMFDVNTAVEFDPREVSGVNQTGGSCFWHQNQYKFVFWS